MNPWWRRPAPSEGAAADEPAHDSDSDSESGASSSTKPRRRSRRSRRAEHPPADVVSSSDVLSSALLEAEADDDAEDEGHEEVATADSSSTERKSGTRRRRRRRRRRPSQDDAEDASESGRTARRESKSEAPRSASQDDDDDSGSRSERPSRRRRRPRRGASEAETRSSETGTSERGTSQKGTSRDAPDAERPFGSDARVAVYVDLAGVDLAAKRLDRLEQWLGSDQITSSRAYRTDVGARPERHRREIRRLAAAGVDLIESEATGRAATLVQLTADAVEQCLENPAINTVTLVSSNPDLVPLVAKLREVGRRVVLLSGEEADERLLSHCDAFYRLDRVDRVDPDGDEAPAGGTEGGARRGRGRRPEREPDNTAPADPEPAPESRDAAEDDRERRPRRRRRRRSSGRSDSPSESSPAETDDRPAREPRKREARREAVASEAVASEAVTSEGGPEPLGGSDPLGWIQRGVEALLEGPDDRLLSPRLQQWIRQRRPDFNEHALGYDSFGEMIRAAEEKSDFRVVPDERTGLDWIEPGGGTTQS